MLEPRGSGLGLALWLALGLGLALGLALTIVGRAVMYSPTRLAQKSLKSSFFSL